MRKQTFLPIILVLALTVAAPAVTGESVPNPTGELIGIWQVDWAADDLPKTTVTLSAGGAFSILQNDKEPLSGEYAVAGDTITFHSESESKTFFFAVDGNILTVFAENQDEVFVLTQIHQFGHPLIGLWVVDASTIGDAEASMEFFEHGMMTAKEGEKTVAMGLYTVTGNTLTIAVDGFIDIAAFSIEGDTLTISGGDQGQVLVLIRRQ